MKISSTKYTGSFTQLADCPDPNRVEFAFTGRSNVGKSSLLNMLLDRKELANTSKNPGRTQRLNFFLINNDFYFVDMPGYGYAKRSKKERQQWDVLMRSYFRYRMNLECAFLLIDSRIAPQNSDIEMAKMLGAFGIPLAIIFTKTDQVKKQQLNKNIAAFKDELLKIFAFLPHSFLTSAKTKTGRDELLTFIQEVNATAKQDL